MLQAQVREIHGDKLARWDDAKHILARREGERRHAEELAEQLMAAQRLGNAFDRGRVPEVVRQTLAGLDQGERMGSDELDRRKAKLVDALTRVPGMHQIVEKALAPQKQIIEQERQRTRGKEIGGPQR